MEVNEQIYNALKRLVELKDYKDNVGKDDDYEHEKVFAWYDARKALEKANELATIDGRVVCKDCGKPTRVEYTCNNHMCLRAWDKNP